MKQLLAVLLVYVFLFTNSCNHSKISFGRKHNHNRIEKVNEERNNPKPKQAQLKDVAIESSDLPLAVEEKQPLGERTIEQLGLLLDEESSETFHAIIDKSNLKKRLDSKPDNQSKKQENKERDSSSLIIFGVLLLLGGIGLVFYAINRVDSGSNNSVDGCLTSLLIGLMLSVLAIMLGALGLIMIIIGMVVYFRK